MNNCEATTKTGSWVEHPDGYMILCSICGDDWLASLRPHLRYCPHCGAKMEDDRK